MREAEFAQITRQALFTLFDVTWPQGGKLGTLTGVLSDSFVLVGSN
jgi:hypothetical protein